MNLIIVIKKKSPNQLKSSWIFISTQRNRAMREWIEKWKKQEKARIWDGRGQISARFEQIERENER